MPQSAISSMPVRSARPAVTAELMEATGLDEELLTALVHRFYDRARADPLLGPVFDARIENWGPHLCAGHGNRPRIPKRFRHKSEWPSWGCPVPENFGRR
jgi:hypothetical protein